MTQLQLIQPRDERERQMIERYENDLRERWDVAVGPLIRRTRDGKLIRMPDRGSVTRADPQVATDAFVLGRGPGREYGVMICWIETAKDFMDRCQPDRLRALVTALRNEQRHRQNLDASALAERSAARRQEPLLAHVKRDALGMVAPVRQDRTSAPHRTGRRVLAPAGA